MARVGWVCTPEDLETIKDMAARGIAEYKIAQVMGIHANTFQARKAESLDIQNAIKEGKGQLEQFAADKLIQIMMDDNHPKMFNALQLFLTRRCGWSEHRTVDVTGPSAPSSIKFNVDEADD